VKEFAMSDKQLFEQFLAWKAAQESTPASEKASPVLKKDIRKALRAEAKVTTLHTLHKREGQPYASASERKAFVACAKKAGYGDVAWVKSIKVS
jgi:hypothetical protein